MIDIWFILFTASDSRTLIPQINISHPNFSAIVTLVSEEQFLFEYGKVSGFTSLGYMVPPFHPIRTAGSHMSSHTSRHYFTLSFDRFICIVCVHCNWVE